MLNTYRATLRGRVLEWLQDEPKDSHEDQPLEVFVTFLTEARPASKKAQGKKMSVALTKIANLPDSSVRLLNVTDWQRDTRLERTLPGQRNDDECR